MRRALSESKAWRNFSASFPWHFSLSLTENIGAHQVETRRKSIMYNIKYLDLGVRAIKYWLNNIHSILLKKIRNV